MAEENAERDGFLADLETARKELAEAQSEIDVNINRYNDAVNDYNNILSSLRDYTEYELEDVEELEDMDYPGFPNKELTAEDLETKTGIVEATGLSTKEN